MTAPGLDALLDDAAVWAGIGQCRLRRLREPLGGGTEATFGLDLTEPARFWFESEPAGTGRLEFLPHLIASVAPGPGTVRWAWALDGLSDYPAAALSRRLADLGRSQEVPALAEPEVSVATLLPGSGHDQAEVAHRIGALACLAVGEVPYHVFPAGAGTLGVLLLQPRAPLPEPLAADLVETVTGALAAGRLSDHRRSLWSATQRLRWPTDTRDARRWQVRAPDRPVDVALDVDHQITSATLA